ncbi:MAG TPA: hypothetical protein DCX98_11390 [Eubacterium sp.]|nr:hypothetical protein [Eubacterium sp.]
MKHSLEERMDIGRRMYLHEITYKEAMEIYGLSESCAHKYMTDYKKAQGIPLANTVPKMKNPAVLKPLSSPDIDTYMAMSKEELINELIIAKANELRAKKGYEVKGAGANKEYIILNNKNTKS